MGSSYTLDSQVKRGGAIALVDCNNFFVSCERAFAPKFRNKPALVLSNNDGCVVARSQEVKKLGVEMGVPLFKIDSLVKKHNIKVFSSNYQLYSDMSKRVVEAMRSVVDKVEVYSVDEAFIDLSEIESTKLATLGSEIRNRVHQWTGIPVSVGIAPTKTLAKIATEIGKGDGSGVCDMYNMPDSAVDNFLAKFEARDVWGIGRQITKQLATIGIKSALNVKYSDEQSMRRKFSVNIYKTVLELRGISCFPISIDSKLQKGIAYTRSFATPVTTQEKLFAILANFTALACEKLRKQGGIARQITVFARTSQFAPPDLFFYKGLDLNLGFHTNDTRHFLKQIEQIMPKLFVKNVKYKKAGVILGNILESSSMQYNLFGSTSDNIRLADDQVISAVDAINQKWGQGSVMYCSALLAKDNVTKRELISKRYTTDWGELLRVG
jgi:DNA polymerase V